MNDYLICTSVFTDDTPEFTDNGESLPAKTEDSNTEPISAEETDTVSAYMDIDVFREYMTFDSPFLFSVGFAFATLLILLTYGVFKVFGLIRIKT